MIRRSFVYPDQELSSIKRMKSVKGNVFLSGLADKVQRMHPLTVAKEMTLIDAESFQNIPVTEFTVMAYEVSLQK